MFRLLTCLWLFVWINGSWSFVMRPSVNQKIVLPKTKKEYVNKTIYVRNTTGATRDGFIPRITKDDKSRRIVKLELPNTLLVNNKPKTYRPTICIDYGSKKVGVTFSYRSVFKVFQPIENVSPLKVINQLNRILQQVIDDHVPELKYQFSMTDSQNNSTTSDHEQMLILFGMPFNNKGGRVSPFDMATGGVTNLSLPLNLMPKKENPTSSKMLFQILRTLDFATAFAFDLYSRGITPSQNAPDTPKHMDSDDQINTHCLYCSFTKGLNMCDTPDPAHHCKIVTTYPKVFEKGLNNCKLTINPNKYLKQPFLIMGVGEGYSTYQNTAFNLPDTLALRNKDGLSALNIYYNFYTTQAIDTNSFVILPSRPIFFGNHHNNIMLYKHLKKHILK